MKKCPWCGQEYPDEVLVCTIDRNPLESCDPVAPIAEPQASASGKADFAEKTEPEAGSTGTPDGFRWLGVLETFEANRLLKQFLEADIRFQIDNIERRERSGSTSYRTVRYIVIFVHADDYEKANQLLTADWKV